MPKQKSNVSLRFVSRRYACVIDLTNVVGSTKLYTSAIHVDYSQGDISTMYETWRGTVVTAMGHIEALIDFAEDEQFEDGVWEKSMLHLVIVLASPLPPVTPT